MAYSGKLTGSAKKKFGLIAGSMQGTLSEILPVSSGNHQIRVQVQPEQNGAARLAYRRIPGQHRAQAIDIVASG